MNKDLKKKQKHTFREKLLFKHVSTISDNRKGNIYEPESKKENSFTFLMKDTF